MEHVTPTHRGGKAQQATRSTPKTPGEFIQRRLAWTAEFRWFDKVGMLQLDEDRFARSELCAPVVVGSYSRVEVKIVSKRAGVIDSKSFSFGDYLPDTPAARADSRPDYHAGYYAWHYQGECDWYIGVPNDTRPLTQAVEDYIGLFS
jgi:hypothetical protein